MDDLFSDQDDLEPTLSEDHDYLAELVGDNKKFKTAADLAKGKAHADVTIELLKKKLDDLTKEVNTRKSLEQFMTEMEKRNVSEPAPPFEKPDEHQGIIDENALESRLEELLARREGKNKAESNRQLVARVLTEQLPNPKQAIQSVAQSVGMSVQELQGFAERSPQAFFKLMGIQEGAPVGVRSVAPRSSISGLESPSGKPSPYRGHSYYEKLKVSDPKKYNSPETVNDMINDAMLIGGLEKFYAS